MPAKTKEPRARANCNYHLANDCVATFKPLREAKQKKATRTVSLASDAVECTPPIFVVVVAYCSPERRAVNQLLWFSKPDCARALLTILFCTFASLRGNCNAFRGYLSDEKLTFRGLTFKAFRHNGGRWIGLNHKRLISN